MPPARPRRRLLRLPKRLALSASCPPRRESARPASPIRSLSFGPADYPNTRDKPWSDHHRLHAFARLCAKIARLGWTWPPKSAAFGAPLRSTNHHSPLHPSRDYVRTGSRRACCSRNVRLSDTHPSSSQCYLQHNTGAVVGPPARPTPTSRPCRGQRCNFPSHGKPASSRPAGDHSASSDVRSCCRKCTSAGYLHLALLSILRY